MNVLVVDDSVLELGMHDKLLSRFEGCESVGFTNPLDALDWSRSNEVDILIVDYLMPEMNGIDFLTSFRSMEGNKGIPALIVTASKEKRVRYQALDLGANDFLTKPIDIPEYLARMNNMITLRSHQRQLTDRADWLAGEVDKATATLSTLIENLPEGIVLLDETGRVILANGNGYDYLNVLAGGMSDDVLTNLGGRSVESLLPSQGQRRWHEMRTSGSKSRCFRVAAESIGLTDQPGSIVLVIIDITEEAAIQERAHFQERLAAVGQLAAGIAHDFNNTLTVISASAQLLLMDKSIPPKTHERVATINNQVGRAVQLVRQVLDFSRPSSQEKKAMDLVPFTKGLSKLFRRIIPENIRISLDCERGVSHWVKADPSRLEQILTNLAVNARDAMPEGGDLEIHLSSYNCAEGGAANLPIRDMASGQWVVLSVSDTGTGIAPEVLPRIFDPFFTTKERGKGTGLGLSLVYGLVTEHGGFIDVKSKVGAGTVFIICLPMVDNEPRQFYPDKGGGLPYGRGESILLVEDDEDVVTATQMMLERLNYIVVTARNGREALETFGRRGSEFAAVLSDMMMPEMGGIELLHQLRDASPDLPILFITGYPLSDTARAFVDSGFVGHMEKPLSIGELARGLTRHINGGMNGR